MTSMKGIKALTTYLQINVVNKYLFHFNIRCRHWLPFCFLAFPIWMKRNISEILSIMVKMTLNDLLLLTPPSLHTYLWRTNITIAEIRAPTNTIPPKTPTISPERGNRHNNNVFMDISIKVLTIKVKINGPFMPNHNRSNHNHYIYSDCTCTNTLLLIRVWQICSSQQPSGFRWKNTFTQSVRSG